MNLFRLLQARADEGRPVRVGVIGAGKFSSMFLSQARLTPGMHLVGIADLDPDKARQACLRTGWSPEALAFQIQLPHLIRPSASTGLLLMIHLADQSCGVSRAISHQAGFEYCVGLPPASQVRTFQ